MSFSKNCQSSVLHMLKTFDEQKPIILIRQLDEMSRSGCSGTTYLRNMISTQLGHESMKRISNLEATDKDEIKAKHVMKHYADECKDKLYLSLTLANKMKVFFNRK